MTAALPEARVAAVRAQDHAVRMVPAVVEVDGRRLHYAVSDNVGAAGPVGAMLMTVDLRAEVGTLADAGLPMLAEWGASDRVVGSRTADEFARCARTAVQWVPGGHSWMIARPQSQADLFSRLASGQEFVELVGARHRTSCRSARRRARRQLAYAAAPAATASAHV